MDTTSGAAAANRPDDTELLRVLFQGKWRLKIVSRISLGPTRLSELRRSIPECTKKMLIDNLHALENLGWVVRCEVPSTVRRVEYRLSDAYAEAIRRLLEDLNARNPTAQEAE